MKAKSKKPRKKDFNNDALSQNASDLMGTTDLGFPFNPQDPDPYVPDKFVNDSGDPNQIGRSEEEELENNTVLDMNKNQNTNSDLLSEDKKIK